jgi:hypothetical protein
MYKMLKGKQSLDDVKDLTNGPVIAPTVNPETGTASPATIVEESVGTPVEDPPTNTPPAAASSTTYTPISSTISSTPTSTTTTPPHNTTTNDPAVDLPEVLTDVTVPNHWTFVGWATFKCFGPMAPKHWRSTLLFTDDLEKLPGGAKEKKKPEGLQSAKSCDW